MLRSVKRWALIVVLATVLGRAIFLGIRKPAGPPLVPGTRQFLTNAVRLLEDTEAAMAEKYWGSELLAEKHGALFERLWDSLNRASNKFAVLKGFTAPKVVWGIRNPAREIGNAVRILDASERTMTFKADSFRELLEEKEAEGWQLAQCEFRHIGFAPEKKPYRESVFYFSAHLENSRAKERAILEGDLIVKWGRGEPGGLVEIDASDLQLRMRKGDLPFSAALDLEVAPPHGSYFIDPLIVYDLDRDGLPEIILAARNEVYQRGANGEWNAAPLCGEDPGLIFTGVVADFNSDGFADFLEAKFDGLFLHEGTKQGKFPNPARFVWQARPRLKYAQVMTCGDVDEDGDLDLFLGQYKVPYEKGNMPVPYFEANDGNPSFLLLNDGKGNFTNVTSERGLEGKQNRRVYSGSFVDMDGDKDLDLLLVSDFAGIDVFENDGRGNFADATKKWFRETRAFGMAHCFSDFNADGRMDILLIGMNSPTADRLESMGLSRPYKGADGGMRKAVSYGNRLYFGTAEGMFVETGLSRQIARTGWTWGCGAADFDGDGFTDLYVGNGHDSRESVREYDSEFWLHDIYAGGSRENGAVDEYFRKKSLRTRGSGWSYGGYEKNRLFLNEHGTNFTEVGFLFGVALEADSRNVVAKDVTGDGAADLVVTTFEVYPRIRQTLKVFDNRLAIKKGSTAPSQITVTGDSYRSQAQ